MHNTPRIIVFIAVFLCVVLLPILINSGSAAAQITPALDTPEIQDLPEYACIEPTEYMRSEHMLLLDAWRTEVIRGSASHYISSSGQIYEMSLVNTCFSCHSNGAEFCASCHDSLAVSPDCWNCHDGGEAAVGS